MNITFFVGQNIRNYRKRKGVKLSALADKIQIDKSTLSKMETGHISITIERVGKIAEALGVDFNELIVIQKPVSNETPINPTQAYMGNSQSSPFEKNT